MNARPILFSGAMVRALLAGTKMQTRRIVKPQPKRGEDMEFWENGCTVNPRPMLQYGRNLADGEFRESVRCPYGAAGDLLWVREASAIVSVEERTAYVARAERMPAGKTLAQTDGGLEMFELDPEQLEKARKAVDSERFKPSIHMHRWASRLTLRLTDIRVERLQEISEADARAEGVLYVAGHGEITKAELDADPGYSNYLNCRMGYETLWEQINGCGSWKANPWVWVLQFETIKRNVDAVMADAS